MFCENNRAIGQQWASKYYYLANAVQKRQKNLGVRRTNIVHTRGQQYQFVEGQYQYQYLQEAGDNTQYQYQYCQDARVNTQYQCRAQGQYLNTNTRYCWCLIRSKQLLRDLWRDSACVQNQCVQNI